MIMFFSGDDYASKDVPETMLKNPAVMLTFWHWDRGQPCGRLKRHLLRNGLPVPGRQKQKRDTRS